MLYCFILVVRLVNMQSEVYMQSNGEPLHHLISAHVLCGQAARKSYLTSVALLVELASLQTAFLTLDEAIKTTNRRVNALDSVVKPMLENTIAYIKVRTAEGSTVHTSAVEAHKPAHRRPTAAHHTPTPKTKVERCMLPRSPGSPGGFSPDGSGLHGKQFVLTAR